MMSDADQRVLAAARESLAIPLQFDEFLATLSPKDRASAARRVIALDADLNGPRAVLWKRLACSLIKLAPHAAKLVGKQTLQAYVPDGRYRMQVFALEDLQDGNFTVYCPDVLEEAVRSGLLVPAPAVDGRAVGGYVTAVSREPLAIEQLDGKTLHPPVHIKDLTGWNRKALRITLAPSPSPEQVETTELLCAIAAQHFVRTVPPVTASAPTR